MSAGRKSRPYSDAVDAYLAAGWEHVIPLGNPGERGVKAPVPNGTTGRRAVTPTPEQIERWRATHADNNIGVHLVRGYIGIDVDHYDKVNSKGVTVRKRGGDFIAAQEAVLGELPPTYRSTSRGGANPSSIRFYRVPADLDFVHNLGDAVEIIQPVHRYAAVWPSRHENGGVYRWYSPDGEVMASTPSPEDFTDLSVEWVEFLRKDRNSLAASSSAAVDAAAELSLRDVKAWLARYGEGTPCRAMAGTLRAKLRELEAGATRHDAANDGAWALLALIVEGHRGGRITINEFGAAFKDAVEGEASHDRAEWARIVKGGVSKHAVLLAESEAPPPDGLGPWQAHPDGACPDRDDGEDGGERDDHGRAQHDEKRVRYQWASEIEPEKARWLWDRWIPVGELSLLSGREGVGKSTLAYQLISDITRGRLDGEFRGEPRSVLVVATEDSWAHTIVPRLRAAGADLTRIAKLTAERADGGPTPLDLNFDLADIEEVIEETEAVLVVLDPLMSRLGGKLDTHKDSEVRVVLEPLVDVAQRAQCAILGLIHQNKTGTTDPLNAVMGSKAFTAVARSVLVVLIDPDDPSNRMLGHAKSNLGALYEGLMTFTIDKAFIDHKDERIPTSKLTWGEDEVLRSLRDVIAECQQTRRSPTVGQQAAEWIADYLRRQPSQSAEFKELLADADVDGFTRDQIYKGKHELGEAIESTRVRARGGAATWTLVEPTALVSDIKMRGRRASRAGGE